MSCLPGPKIHGISRIDHFNIVFKVSFFNELFVFSFSFLRLFIFLSGHRLAPDETHRIAEHAENDRARQETIPPPKRVRQVNFTESKIQKRAIITGKDLKTLKLGDPERQDKNILKLGNL